MDDAEKERRRKALAAMMANDTRADIGKEFEEKEPPVRKECGDCSGTGKCQACQGSGAEECPTCRGSGRVGAYHTKVTKGTDHIYVSQASGFGGTCPDCGGRGIKTNFWPSTQSVKCKYCEGSGKCKVCGGYGYYMWQR